MRDGRVFRKMSDAEIEESIAKIDASVEKLIDRFEHPGRVREAKREQKKRKEKHERDAADFYRE